MDSILQFKNANCKNCYKCIRKCPVKSIKVADHQANIIDNECILCGLCSVECPQNAKQIRNDLDIVKRLIHNGKEEGRQVIASIAPSFIADFDVSSLEQMEPVFKKLGFSQATETAVGAKIIKTEYENIIKNQSPDVLISSCCHSVNLLIQKYHPQALPYLAHVMSPMLAHAKYLKEQDENCLVVFIGPCVSKKAECEEYGIVDCVLTFDELREWLNEEQIHIPENSNQDSEKRRSRFFPTTGGIIKSMDKAQSKFNYLAVDGVENCIQVLKEIEQGNLKNCFIEMSACKGSCIGGPSMEKYQSAPIACTTRVANFAGQSAFCETSLKDFEETNDFALNKKMGYLGIKTIRPGESEIITTLRKMGKTKPEDELNCGSCGYNTCREKAIAVCEGKADLSMCLPYLKEKAESFSDKIINTTPNAIIAMDEELNIQQINKSACKLLNINDYKSVIGSPIFNYLDPTKYIKAMDDGNCVAEEKYYLEKQDKFIEEYIVYDKSYKIVISIMKDITDIEKENKQRAEIQHKTAEITDKMIEKQMRVVQEIASLLGETTAETKIALSNLKETLLK